MNNESSQIDPSRPLSQDETVQLSEHLAALSRGGLPLGDGLRAAAAELPRGRLSDSLTHIADSLDRGQNLDTALAAQGRRLPDYLRGLVAIGVRTGRLPEVLTDFVARQRAAAELRGSLWSVLAYPVLLLAVLIVMCIFGLSYIVPPLGQVYADFGTELPAQTVAIAWLSEHALPWIVGGLLCTLAAIVLLRWLGGASLLSRVVYALPIVGPIWRWTGLAETASLCATLVEHSVPLPSALRLTATCTRQAALAATCVKMAQRTQSGRPLNEVAAEVNLPPIVVAILGWGAGIGDLSRGFQAVADFSQRRAALHAQMARIVLPPLMFLLIAATSLFLIVGVLSPLVRLISDLT